MSHMPKVVSLTAALLLFGGGVSLAGPPEPTKRPDLVVKKVKLSLGQPVLWATIANQGDGPAMGSFVCFSDPTDKSKSYGNSGVGPIAAGGEDQVGVGTGLLGELGVKVAKGVLITADCKNQVAESNENNNTYRYPPEVPRVEQLYPKPKIGPPPVEQPYLPPAKSK